ncbi:MAG: hypothetical protein J1F67_11890 [Muribaculaceae bacterium]|nr:hypothetical protein [Muribaculaceae bacterium]
MEQKDYDKFFEEYIKTCNTSGISLKSYCNNKGNEGEEFLKNYYHSKYFIHDCNRVCSEIYSALLSMENLMPSYIIGDHKNLTDGQIKNMKEYSQQLKNNIDKIREQLDKMEKRIDKCTQQLN